MPLDYAQLLKRINLKVTPKRLAILSILHDEPVYLSPESVWRKMMASFGKVGLPTVYRNLEELERGGIITRIIHPNRKLYYYFCGNEERHHHHFICLSCNAVEELDYCPGKSIEINVEKRLKGRALSHLLQVSGLCKRCLSDKDE